MFNIGFMNKVKNKGFYFRIRKKSSGMNLFKSAEG